mgnify:FL=1
MSKNIQNHRYITGLDGLRAFSVLAVMAYHFNFNWAEGGFLGVDIFFVISGYLITSSILTQKSELNFSLRRFWIRRIRRLLPAAYIAITGIFIWATMFKSEIAATLKGDAAASIFYVSNWWFIFHKISYFDSFGSPSPLKNLWSLSIEEQFYIIWPLMLIAGIKIFKKRTKLSNAVFIAALCSAVLMAVLYKPGEDPSRVYYGTDTRAFELLIGGWLAIIYPIKKTYTGKISTRQKNKLNITSAITLSIFIISVVFVNEYNSFLYRGGMLLFSLNAAVLIACICHSKSYLGHLLSWKPLSWIGKRSYGIYLWHYPIIVLSTPIYEMGNPTYWRAGLQLAVTFIIAEISYRFIEMPIRKNGFQKTFKKYLSGNIASSRKPAFSRLISVMILMTLGVGLLTACVKSIHMDKTQAHAGNKAGTNSLQQPQTNKESGTSTCKNGSLNSPHSVNPYGKVLAIGDSIMLDITPSLNKRYSNFTIDAKVGRQLNEAIGLASSYTEFNNSNNAVILELGTNGYFTDAQIDKLIKCFSKSHIYLINTRVPRRWEKDVNKILSRKAEENSNVTLIDWHSRAVSHPEYFEPDGVHLKPEGVETLTSLIDSALK